MDVLEECTQELRDMAEERDWNQFHTPRNILLALVGEVGELAELFQWRTDFTCQRNLPEWSDKDRQKVRDEVADVFAYVVRFADLCGINLLAAFREKMVKNRAKYPVELCYGKSTKYNELEAAERRVDRSPSVLVENQALQPHTGIGLKLIVPPSKNDNYTTSPAGVPNPQSNVAASSRQPPKPPTVQKRKNNLESNNFGAHQLGGAMAIPTTSGSPAASSGKINGTNTNPNKSITFEDICATKSANRSSNVNANGTFTGGGSATARPGHQNPNTSFQPHPGGIVDPGSATTVAVRFGDVAGAGYSAFSASSSSPHTGGPPQHLAPPGAMFKNQRDLQMKPSPLSRVPVLQPPPSNRLAGRGQNAVGRSSSSSSSSAGEASGVNGTASQKGAEESSRQSSSSRSGNEESRGTGACLKSGAAATSTVGRAGRGSGSFGRFVEQRQQKQQFLPEPPPPMIVPPGQSGATALETPVIEPVKTNNPFLEDVTVEAFSSDELGVDRGRGVTKNSSTYNMDRTIHCEQEIEEGTTGASGEKRQRTTVTRPIAPASSAVAAQDLPGSVSMYGVPGRGPCGPSSQA
ncbi:unnamed protein product [Amoebophrya sp. A120]|nr:unnamed protein product [Amoebophrya sp. A120]|eukprot:GSA120T00004023001.1